MNRTLAQITNPVIPGSLGSGGGEAGAPAIGSIVGAVIGMLLVFSFVGAFIYLIMGGFDWVTSGGDKTKLQTARDKITNAIIGLIIVASVWAVMTLVGQFIGITFPDLPVPTVQNY